MSNSPGFRGGAIGSAIPKSLSSSPNPGLPRQRTCQVARVSCFLPSNSIESSFSKKVANPLGAIFGSLMTNPVAARTRGRFPSWTASCCPSVLLFRKPCSRKNPHPTIAYVAIKFGQRRTTKAQIATLIAITRRTSEEGRRNSEKIIPTPAITARPTNGWRGAPNKFIVPLFVHFAGTTQALLVRSRAALS